MKSLFAQMAREIVARPTLVVVESALDAETGDCPRLMRRRRTPPPATSALRQGGRGAPDLTREHYRKSFARIVQMVGAMHKAGVPIVAGTDGSGMELVRELELYVQAGFTPAEALAAATIVAARECRRRKDTGRYRRGQGG